MPITPTEKIWMNGELVAVGRRPHPHPHPHAPLRHGRVRGDPRLRDRPRSRRVPPHRPHRAAVPLGRRSSAWRSPTRSTSSCRPPRTPCASHGLPGCYVRPIAYYGYGEMGLNTLPCTVDVSIACWPWGAYLGDDALTKGVRMKISSWTRHDHNTMPPASKTTGNYVNSQPGQGRGAQGGLRRGAHAQPAGVRVASAPARTSSWPATAGSSRRRCRPARSRASRRTR